MNRATAETAHDQALQEGLLPLMRWVKELVDRTLSEGFGYHDLEFAWQESNDLDALTQAKIAQVYLAAGVLTPQEVRASLGLGNEQKGGAANAGRPFGKLLRVPDQSKAPAATTGGGQSGGGGGNPYHDEKGRFTTGPGGVGGGGDSVRTLENRGGNQRYGVILTSGEIKEDEASRRGVPESLNEEADAETYSNLEARLREIEPNNRKLDRITTPGWRPGPEDNEEIREEVEAAEARARETKEAEARSGNPNSLGRDGLPTTPEEMKERGYVEEASPILSAMKLRAFVDPCTGERILFRSSDESLSGPYVPPVPEALLEKETHGDSEVWSKSEGLEGAKRDFYGLRPSDVEVLPNGSLRGTLPDGRTVLLRSRSGKASVNGPPTIEIQNNVPVNGKFYIKVRYQNGDI